MQLKLPRGLARTYMYILLYEVQTPRMFRRANPQYRYLPPMLSLRGPFDYKNVSTGLAVALPTLFMCALRRDGYGQEDISLSVQGSTDKVRLTGCNAIFQLSQHTIHDHCLNTMSEPFAFSTSNHVRF